MTVKSQELHIYTRLRHNLLNNLERDPQIQPLDPTNPLQHLNSSKLYKHIVNLSLLID